MRFWDTSALIPLLREEPTTTTAEALLRSDPVVVVWWGTLIECTSAITRAEHSDGPGEIIRTATRRLRGFAAGWLEIPPSEAIRNDARRLLRLHPLRAGDALQLAAALGVCRGDPEGFPFVCANRRLGEAAARQGFDLQSPRTAE